MSDWSEKLSYDATISRLFLPERLYAAEEAAMRGGAPREAAIYPESPAKWPFYVFSTFRFDFGSNVSIAVRRELKD